MVMPNYFQTEKSVNVLYDSQDITARTGYKRFYLANSKDSSTTTYYITPRTVRGFEAQALTTTTTEFNYDYTFGVPAIIEGVATLEITQAAIYASSSSTTGHFVARILHVSEGAVETQLGTWTSSDVTGDSINTTIGERVCARYDLARTDFTIGSKLRVELICYKTGGGASGTFQVYCDPSSMEPLTDSISRTFPTSAILDLPFKIDL